MSGLSIPIVLADGKPRNLRYDFNAIIAIEEELGVELDAIKEKMSGPGKKMRFIRDLLWAGLIHEDKDITREMVGTLIDTGNVENVVTAIVSGIAHSAAGDGEPKN